MKIKDVQESIEESLANLPSAVLAAELDGLRHLPLEGHDAQVQIRYSSNQRKVRDDADSTYFDPDTCELIIRFTRLETGPEESHPVSGQSSQPGPADGVDEEGLLDQLIDELRRVEEERPFVGLKWFRDQFLRDAANIGLATFGKTGPC